MKRETFVIIGMVATAIVFVLYITGKNEETPDIAKSSDIKQLVQDYSAGEFSDQTASITSHKLIVTKGESQVEYTLPEDEFFVSIAPYIENTHNCATHSLTGCRGELINEEFSVYIEDKNGNVFVNETLRSQANGFIDLWLPRNKTYNTTIAYDGKTTVSEFSTFENDNTCITTMQLEEGNNA